MKRIILKNIKYNQDIYKAGDEIEINEDDIPEFVRLEIISNSKENEFIPAPLELEEDDSKAIALEKDKSLNQEDMEQIDTSKLTKADMVKILQEKEIPFNPSAKKDELAALLNE